MFEDRVKKVSKVDLNLENDLKRGIHFLPNYNTKRNSNERGLPFESFEMLKN